jgi:hypothetical protein
MHQVTSGDGDFRIGTRRTFQMSSAPPLLRNDLCTDSSAPSAARLPGRSTCLSEGPVKERAQSMAQRMTTAQMHGDRTMAKGLYASRLTRSRWQHSASEDCSRGSKMRAGAKDAQTPVKHVPRIAGTSGCTRSGETPREGARHGSVLPRLGSASTPRPSRCSAPHAGPGARQYDVCVSRCAPAWMKSGDAPCPQTRGKRGCPAAPVWAPSRRSQQQHRTQRLRT